MDLTEFVLNCVFHLQKLKDKEPETYWNIHTKLVGVALTPERISQIDSHARLMLLNHLKNWVYADAVENHASLIKDSGAVVDHVHYRWEMEAMKNLNNQISYSDDLIIALYDAAKKTIDSFSENYDLSNITILFPHLNDQEKFNVGIYYAENFLRIFSERLGIPMDMPIFHMMSQRGNVLAAHTSIENGDGSVTSYLGISPKGLKCDLAEFINSIQHELIHHIIDAVGRAEVHFNSNDPRPYHDFHQDVLLAWASKKNEHISSSYFPDLYDEDKEELLCNTIGYLAKYYIERFDPNRHITQQPLMDIA